MANVLAAVKVFVNERLGIRTWEDVRAVVHVLSPYLVTILVNWSLVSEDKARLLVAMAAAAFSPALALWNTQDGFRRWVYGLLPAAQGLIVGFGWASDSQVTPVMAGIVALLGGALASINTRTSHGRNDQHRAAA